MKFQMVNDVNHVIKKIIESIQNQQFEQSENINLLLTSNEFLKLISSTEREELKEMLTQVEFTIALLNTQQALLLDELILIQKGKKALALYD